MTIDLAKFIQQRNEALLSLDREKIVAYAKAYGVPMPEDETLLWASVHRARLTLTAGIPELEKEKSRVWLREHGYRPVGVGE